MPDYSFIANPAQQDPMRNVLGMVGQMSQLQSLEEEKRRRQNAMDIGGVAASSGLADAQKLALQRGELDTYVRMRSVAAQMDTEKLREITNMQEQIGNLARLADTPEKWSRAVAAAKSHGVSIQGYEDFETGRQLAIAQAKAATEALSDERTKRESQIAELRAGLVRNVTAKGGDGSDIGGTAKIDPSTGQIDMRSFSLAPAGIEVGSSAAPGEMAGGGRQADRAQLQAQIKAQFSKDHPGEELSDIEAAGAASTLMAKGGGGTPQFSKDQSGKWTFSSIRAPEGSLAYTRTNEGRYEQTFAGKAAAQDVSVAARKQLGSVIDEHATHLGEVANRPEFNTAMAFLHTPAGLQYWEGKAIPFGTNVPKTAIDIKQTVDSITGEYTNFVSQGHKGGMSEHEAAVIRGIGQSLYNAPDADTFKANLANLRVLSSAFQHVKPVGPKSEWGAAKQSTQEAGPKRVTSKDEYDALPKGAEFIAPDGSHRRKP